jgi:hypothetical protein
MIELRGPVRTAVLLAGVVAPLLCVGTDLLAGSLRPGYSFAAHSVSVLSAPGAPTRPMFVALSLVGYSLIVVLGAALWTEFPAAWAPRAMAGLIVGGAVLQALAVTFFPFHPSAPASDPANVLNVAFMAPSIVAWFLALGFAVLAFANWFRFFTVGLLGSILALSLLATAGVALLIPGGHPGSLVGMQERTLAYGYYLWLGVLALMVF